MLLGKRPRPPVMRRTTSISGGMAVDMQVSNLEAQEEVVSDPMNLKDGIKDPHPHATGPNDGSVAQPDMNIFGAKGYDYDEHLVGMVVSPPSTTTHHQNQTTNSPHVIHTAPFLRTCGLCKHPLASGRDIYMYRGDTAFCSLECREQQMKQDERKGKWKQVASDKEDHRASPPTATSKASTESETIAAA